MVITAAARIRKAGCRDAAVLSHHLGVPERRDLVCTEAELFQDLVGLLAEFRRPRHHLARRARQRDGLADQSNVAVLVVRHVLSAGLCVG